MNDHEKENDPKLRPWIEPELEARIVALVLGEASDFEREQLESLIAEDADLAAYRERIAGVHGQIKKLADGHQTNDESPQLPAAMQAELRAAFSGEAAVPDPSLDEIPVAEASFHFHWRKVLAIAAAVALMAIIGSMTMPSYNRIVSTEKTARPPQYEEAADAADAYNYLAFEATESAPTPLAESTAEASDRGRRALLAMTDSEDSSISKRETTNFSSSPQPASAKSDGDTSTLAGGEGYAQVGHGGYRQEIGSSFVELSVSTSGEASSDNRVAELREEQLLPQLAAPSDKPQQQRMENSGTGPGGADDGAVIGKAGEGNLHSLFKRQSEDAGVDAVKMPQIIAGGGNAAINPRFRGEELERLGRPLQELEESLGERALEGAPQRTALKRDVVAKPELKQLEDLSVAGDAAMISGTRVADESVLMPQAAEELVRLPEMIDAKGGSARGQISVGGSFQGRDSPLSANENYSRETPRASGDIDRTLERLETADGDMTDLFAISSLDAEPEVIQFDGFINHGGSMRAIDQVKRKKDSNEGLANPITAGLRSGSYAVTDDSIDGLIASQPFDDESSKSNVNSHASGTTWDSPRAVDSDQGAIFPMTPASPTDFKTRSVAVTDVLASSRGPAIDASDPAVVFDGGAKPLVRNAGAAELSLIRDWKSSQDNKEIKVVREYAYPADYDAPEIETARIAPVEAKPAATAPVGLDETITSTEPFSTFSLHVSDVSFKLAQAALARGEWPEAERIRVEEFVNAFDYGDPLPSLSEKVSCRMEQMIHPFLQQRNLLLISMRTAAAGRSGSTPLNLTLLLDNSGSMERHDRHETVSRAFDLLTAQLQPNDKATLIGFAHTPRLIADQVSGEKRQQLLQAMVETPSEGGTNLEEALDLAFEKARDQKTEGAQNRIILLTDGAANLGDADPDSLAKTVHEMRAAGIAFDAAGIGADGLNDEILEALTRKGDGRYYLLDRPEDADEGFARQIAGALRPAAMNVKVQIEFNPDRVASYKLLGFEKHRLNKEDFRDDSVDAAEIAAEEAGVAVYQFEPLAGGSGDVGTAFLRFRDMSSGEMVEKSWPITYAADTPRPDRADPSVQIASVAALFAAKLKGDALGASVNYGDLKQILSTLPAHFTGLERVQQLQQMIEQAGNLEGGQ